MLGSGETLHQTLLLRLLRKQVEVCPFDTKFGHMKVRIPGLIMWEVQLVQGVSRMNLEMTGTIGGRLVGDDTPVGTATGLT